jgi:biotin carboxyl carrier protein
MIRAEIDGVVLQAHVKPGSVVTAKDLLIEFAA